MMTKQHFKLFAEACSKIENDIEQHNFINKLISIFKKSDGKFDEKRFREYIRRLIKGESLEGLR